MFLRRLFRWIVPIEISVIFRRFRLQSSYAFLDGGVNSTWDVARIDVFKALVLWISVVIFFLGDKERWCSFTKINLKGRNMLIDVWVWYNDRHLNTCHVENTTIQMNELYIGHHQPSWRSLESEDAANATCIS